MPDTPPHMPENLCSNWVIMKLQTHHLADLRASGLCDETIEELGFRSVDGEEAFNILGFTCGSDTPLQIAGKDGSAKPAKYLSQKGAVHRLYIPPSVRQILDDPSKRFIVTEGEKKAAKATQEGFPAVGMAGIWGFRDREHIFIPDLEDIAWKGRIVFIVPDSDVASNNHVRDGVWELGWQLLQRGAYVRRRTV